HVVQLHLRASAAVRIHQRGTRRRLWGRTDRSSRRTARASAAGRQAGGISRWPVGARRAQRAAQRRRTGHRHRPLSPAGGIGRRDVAVLGVGMHRFGAYYGEKPNSEMALVAGMAAMRDAGLTFPDMQAAYVGHIFATVMSGVRVMKEFGLTGLPIQRIENASATGSAGFREAGEAASGRPPRWARVRC